MHRTRHWSRDRLAARERRSHPRLRHDQTPMTAICPSRDFRLISLTCVIAARNRFNASCRSPAGRGAAAPEGGGYSSTNSASSVPNAVPLRTEPSSRGPSGSPRPWSASTGSRCAESEWAGAIGWSICYRSKPLSVLNSSSSQATVKSRSGFSTSFKTSTRIHPAEDRCGLHPDDLLVVDDPELLPHPLDDARPFVGVPAVEGSLRCDDDDFAATAGRECFVEEAGGSTATTLVPPLGPSSYGTTGPTTPAYARRAGSPLEPSIRRSTVEPRELITQVAGRARVASAWRSASTFLTVRGARWRTSDGIRRSMRWRKREVCRYVSIGTGTLRGHSA
jgi:hypothetical protein